MKKSVIVVLAVTMLLSVVGSVPGETGSEGQNDPPIYRLDQPEDGKIDLFDRNADGVVDYTIEYDADGTITSEAQDYNYDGTMDDFYFFEEGLLVRREVDTNFDGLVDLWVYLTDGFFVTGYERDTDYDGIIDKNKEFGGE